MAPAGTTVTAFATGLVHPRWLYVLPNGDVLVAETNAPERPKDNRGIKGWFFKLFQKKAGGAVPSANRITLLRDADGDGVAETRWAFLTGLTSPFGMALVGTPSTSPTPTRWCASRTWGRPRSASPASRCRPAGRRAQPPLDQGLIASADAPRSTCVGSNATSPSTEWRGGGRAAIWALDAATGSQRTSPRGCATRWGWRGPESGRAVDLGNERDELGSDLSRPT